MLCPSQQRHCHSGSPFFLHGVFVGDPRVRHRTGAGFPRFPPSALPKGKRVTEAIVRPDFDIFTVSISPFSIWGLF